ncbi:hypothetical protein chiPu_0011804 [Chiloscyllium punctatum]|uniref:SHSP domain-containing protein n=1 Tax=Chiloscyllium punctatum TaxID=137246 RepID=A0A401SSG1_CHIPU|nr:hypothetical protein [Chiloscyllium punctatum]
MASAKTLENGQRPQDSNPTQNPNKNEKFTLCLNVAGIDPRSIKVSITGRKLEISGQHVRKFKQGELGINRYNYCGFSNELRLPASLDLNTLAATITDDVMITIEAYHYDIGILVEVQDKDDDFFHPRMLPIVYKYTNASNPPTEETKNKDRTFWTPCLFPIPGTRCDSKSALVNVCHHPLPGSLCSYSPSNISFPRPDRD